MIFLLLGCGATPDTGTKDTAPAEEATGAFTDAGNYSYTAALDIGETPIAIDDDVAIEWWEMTTDLRGFPIDAEHPVTAIDLVWLRDLAPDDVEAALVSGTLTQSSVGLVAGHPPNPGDTSAGLAQFDLYGMPFTPREYFSVSGGSWLLRFSTATNADAMLHFLVPQEDGPMVVRLGDDSATLDFTPDLQSLTPVAVGPDLEVRWDTLTRTGAGTAFDPLSAQELWIARYDVDVATLESRFFEIETLATHTWTLNVYGEDDAVLSDAVDTSGAPFPGTTAGLDDGAVWLAALRCTICTSPAPVFLTRLE